MICNTQEENNYNKECSICYDDKDTDYLTICGHYFHEECICKYYTYKKDKSCPYCRSNLNETLFINIIYNINTSIILNNNINIDKLISIIQESELINKGKDYFNEILNFYEYHLKEIKKIEDRLKQLKNKINELEFKKKIYFIPLQRFINKIKEFENEIIKLNTIHNTLLKEHTNYLTLYNISSISNLIAYINNIKKLFPDFIKKIQDKLYLFIYLLNKYKKSNSIIITTDEIKLKKQIFNLEIELRINIDHTFLIYGKI